MGLKRFSFRKASSSLRRGEALGEVRLERGLSAAGSWSCWSLRFMSVQAFASRSGSTARGVSVAGLTAAELKEMMCTLGNDVTEAEIRDIFTEAGCRLDKGIPYESFSKLMGIGVKQKEEDPEDEMRHAFGLFDLDRDGFISAKEMKAALTKFGIEPEPTDKEVAQVLADAIYGSDQKVSYDLFKRVMRGS